MVSLQQPPDTVKCSREIDLAYRELTALLETAGIDRSVVHILLIPSTEHAILPSNLAANLGSLPVLTGGRDSTALMALQTSMTSVPPLSLTISGQMVNRSLTVWAVGCHRVAEPLSDHC